MFRKDQFKLSASRTVDVEDKGKAHVTTNLILITGLILSLERIILLRVNPVVIDHELERIVHKSTIATSVVTCITIN